MLLTNNVSTCTDSTLLQSKFTVIPSEETDERPMDPHWLRLIGKKVELIERFRRQRGKKDGKRLGLIYQKKL